MRVARRRSRPMPDSRPSTAPRARFPVARSPRIPFPTRKSREQRSRCGRILSPLPSDRFPASLPNSSNEDSCVSVQSSRNFNVSFRRCSARPNSRSPLWVTLCDLTLVFRCWGSKKNAPMRDAKCPSKYDEIANANHPSADPSRKCRIEPSVYLATQS